MAIAKFTTYFLNLLVGNAFGTKTNPALPATYWIGVSSTTPNLDGTGVTEPIGGAYGRIKLDTTNFKQSATGTISNSAEVSFPESTDSWGTMTHMVLYDAQSDGNLIMYSELSPTRSVETDTLLYWKTGNIKISIANT